MTIIDYQILTRDVAAAIARVSEAIASAESSNELELLTSRLVKACDVLSVAKCGQVGRGELSEAARLILEGKRLVFAVKMTGKGEEFPRMRKESAA